MPDREIALRFEGVSKSYGQHRALVDLELAVSGGEFLTLLGPSGSGKTTTLMIAAGFVSPSAGRVWLGDREITGIPPHKRNLGVVFQSYALFPHRTVHQNVAFPLRMRKVSKTEQATRVKDVLRLVKLEGYEDRYPHQLSGGQQQRVALARAIVFNPPLLLMDEPLGALDKNLRTEMQLELKRLHQELGLTVVYVTHDQSEALSMSDRVAVMREGVIEQLDAPWSIYEQPSSRFVALFIGDTNVLSGRLEGHVEGTRFNIAEGVSVPVQTTDDMPLAAETTSLVIRAERLRLAHGAGSDGASVAAVATGSVYLGDGWLVECRIRGDQTLRVKVTAPRTAIPEPGDEITVAWDVADGRVLIG